MEREMVRAGRGHRELLRQLFELYVYEFSVWTGEEVDVGGRYTPDDFLLGGWSRRGGVGRYLLQVDGRWAGFAFVERGSYVDPGRAAHWLMEDFFVLRRHRRRGHGEWFVRQLFERLPGTWEIGQIPENLAGTAFWRAVLARAGAGAFQEFGVDNEIWTGPVQVLRVESQSRE